MPIQRVQAAKDLVYELAPHREMVGTVALAQAAVFVEWIGAESARARWYASKYWCPIRVAWLALKWITSLETPDLYFGSPAGILVPSGPGKKSGKIRESAVLVVWIGRIREARQYT